MASRSLPCFAASLSGVCSFPFVGAQHAAPHLGKNHACSARAPIKASSRLSPIAAFCHRHSRRAGRSQEKTPSRLLPQCPALLPEEESRADPPVPAASLVGAFPEQSQFYSRGDAN